MSSTLNIDETDAFNLMFARILLNNDARALALDYVNYNTGYYQFIQESFRSFSNLLGINSSNPPLGVLLYNKLLDVNIENQGANSSLTALTLYFLSPDTVLFVLTLLLLIFILFVLIISKLKSLSNSPVVKLMIDLYLLTSCSLFSQDFLSFQLLIILLPIYLIFIYYVNNFIINNSVSMLSNRLLEPKV
jgi:hypothetical protein